MSRTWQGGSTRAWRNTRQFVLDRDGHRCKVKVPGICTGIATHAHHILGRKITGDDPRYIVASCEPCNLHIGEPATHTNCDLCAQPTPRTRW